MGGTLEDEAADYDCPPFLPRNVVKTSQLRMVMLALGGMQQHYNLVLIVFVEVVILTKRKSVETRTDLISKKNTLILILQDPPGQTMILCEPPPTFVIV